MTTRYNQELVESQTKAATPGDILPKSRSFLETTKQTMNLVFQGAFFTFDGESILSFYQKYGNQVINEKWPNELYSSLIVEIKRGIVINVWACDLELKSLDFVEADKAGESYLHLFGPGFLYEPLPVPAKKRKRGR